MPIELDVRLDVREVERMLGGIGRRVVPKATRSTLNKAARSVQAEAVRLIAKDVGVTQKTIREHLLLKRATLRTLYSSIETKPGQRRISVTRLKPRQTRKGVTYRTQGKRRLIPGAFIATMPQGGRIVVKRKGRQRLPIIKLRTVTITRVFIKQAIKRAMHKVADERWSKVWPNEVRYFMRRELEH